MDAFGLNNGWAAPVMPFRSGFTFSQKLFLELQHEIGVFTMCSNDDAKLLRQCQSMIEFFIADPERAFVGQENFEAGVTALNDILEVAFGFGVVTSYAHVKREI